MFAAVEIQTAEDGAAENHERMSAMLADLVINPTIVETTNHGEGHQVVFEMVDLVLAEVVALEGKRNEKLMIISITCFFDASSLYAYLFILQYLKLR